MLKKELELELYRAIEDRDKWEHKYQRQREHNSQFKKDVVKTFADCLWYYTYVKENNYSRDQVKEYSVNSLEEILFRLWILKQQADQNSDRDYLKTFWEITNRLEMQIRDINESLNPNQ